MNDKKYKNKKWLEKQYVLKNRLVVDIANDCNVNMCTIYSWINIHNIKHRLRNKHQRNSKKYYLKENYFKNINTQEKAYWLGFIAADGCVINKNGKKHLSIELSEKDEEHLHKFKKVIEYNGPIYCKKAQKKTVFEQYVYRFIVGEWCNT